MCKKQVSSDNQVHIVVLMMKNALLVIFLSLLLFHLHPILQNNHHKHNKVLTRFWWNIIMYQRPPQDASRKWVPQEKRSPLIQLNTKQHDVCWVIDHITRLCKGIYVKDGELDSISWTCHTIIIFDNRYNIFKNPIKHTREPVTKLL